ncbi:MAG: cyclase family protein [Candidatus Angelobacter sp.]
MLARKSKSMIPRKSPNRQKRFIDLSHTVENGLLTYKGLPPPVVSDYRSRVDSRGYYADGIEFHIGKIEMVGNTGTYIDAPFHRYADGKDLSELPLASIADLPGIRIASGPDPCIGVKCFKGHELENKAVLVHTGWSRHWLTNSYFENHPFLTAEAAKFLVKSGVALVGIDSVNIDDINDKTRPVHSILLEANIPIVEHLTNLAEAPTEGFQFFAVPVPVKAFGSFPVRAFAITS